MTKAEQLNQVNNFISRGKNIKRKCELQNDMAVAQVGALGFAIAAVVYPIYRAWYNHNKRKYGQKIIDLSNELLNNQDK